MPKDYMIFTSTRSYRHVVNRGARATGQFAGVLTVKIMLDICQKRMKQHLGDPGFKNFRRRNHITPYRVSRLQHSNAFLMILPHRLSLLGYILSRKFTFRFHCLVFFLYNSTLQPTFGGGFFKLKRLGFAISLKRFFVAGFTNIQSSKCSEHSLQLTNKYFGVLLKRS